MTFLAKLWMYKRSLIFVVSLLTGTVIYLTVLKDYGKSGWKLHILTGNDVEKHDNYPSADGLRKRTAPVPVCLKKEAFCQNVKLDTQKDHAISMGSRPANYSRPKIVIWAKQRHCINWTLPTLSNGDGGCDLTFDRNEFEKGDAIVFFMKCCYPMDLPDPSKRRKDQAFVWWSHESPWTVRHFYRRNLTEYNDYFNWTMTYRMDSDVLAPMWPTPLMDYLLLKIGRDDEVVDKSVLKKPTLPEDEFQRELKHLISHKTKFAAWVVTNCGMTWGARERQIFVRSLEKEGGFTIERFGKCVKKEIPFNFPALLQTLSSYKFYFAFENSLHCQDYLTEKTMYNSLIGGNVPVIFGPKSENTAKILPKHSYIHVEDFKNIRDLGLYLKYLDGNDTAYSEYFNWWKDPGAQTFPRFGFNYGPRVLPDEPSYRRLEKDELQDDWLEYERFGLYHLCRKLKNKDHVRTSKTISSLADWFYGNETLECLNKL